MHYVLNGAIFSKNAKKEQLQERILQLLKGREIEELEKELIIQKINEIYTKSTTVVEKQKMYSTPGYTNSGIVSVQCVIFLDSSICFFSESHSVC